MTVSDDHNEYAAAAANQPRKGDNMKAYYKAAVTFVLAYLTALVAAEQGVDLASLSGDDWARGGVGALVTTILMFYTKYQSTNVGPPNG